MHDLDIIVISDIPEFPDFLGEMGTCGADVFVLVYIPIIGTTLTYKGNRYEIVQTATYQNELEDVSHIMTCAPIRADGTFTGEESIELYSDDSGIVAE